MEPFKKLPDCELDIMMTVWHADEPVTSAYVAAHLAEAQRWKPSTLLNFLARLVERGYLRCERQGKTNVYTPLIAEETYLKHESRSLFQRLYGGSLGRMLTALYDGAPLSEQDRAELEVFIERAEQQNRPGK